MTYLKNKNLIKLLGLGAISLYLSENSYATRTMEDDSQKAATPCRENHASLVESKILEDMPSFESIYQKKETEVKGKHIFLMNVCRLTVKYAYERKLDDIKKNNPKLFPFWYTSEHMRKFKRMTPREIDSHFVSYGGSKFFQDKLIAQFKQEKVKLAKYALEHDNITAPDEAEVINYAIKTYKLSPEIATEAYRRMLTINI